MSKIWYKLGHIKYMYFFALSILGVLPLIAIFLFFLILKGTLAGILIGLAQLNCSELKLKRLFYRHG